MTQSAEMPERLEETGCIASLRGAKRRGNVASKREQSRVYSGSAERKQRKTAEGGLISVSFLYYTEMLTSRLTLLMLPPCASIRTVPAEPLRAAVGKLAGSRLLGLT